MVDLVLQYSINQSKNTKKANLFLVSCDSSSKFKNGPVLPHWTIDLHSCHQIPTAFELLIENFFPLIENISKCTFPRLFPGCFPGALFFSFSLFKIPKSIAKKVFFPKPAPFMPGVSWVFPGCFPGVSRVFPGCFPGVSWAFHGCFP